ncbi:MAG: glycosyltransferase [Anaerolineae bacterium]|nr:glycosyltransferase [Anaerolineae bacterium]
MAAKVSVCIPTRNRACYIGATIKSVLDSEYSNIEIIISDNASTDNTQEILNAFDDRRIHFYQNSINVGPIKNWNLAMEKASGDYIGLLYSDDLYGPFWLNLAVHVLDKYPHIGWVSTAFRIINDRNQLIGTVSHFDRKGEIGRPEAFQHAAMLNGLGPVYIARREIPEKLGYYDEEYDFSADNDFFLRLSSRYPLYYSCNNFHAAYRIHADNLSRQWKNVDQISEGLRMLKKAFADCTLSEELHQYERPCYTHLYHRALHFAKKRLEKDDIETAQQVITLLHEFGYNHQGQC